MPDIAFRDDSVRSSGSQESSRQRIADEHRSLRESLELLKDTSDIRRIAPMLENLRPKLEAHFRSEEEPEGLHQAIGDSAPHLLSSLQQIYDEHRGFLASIDRLTGEARQCCEGPVARVLAGIRELCEGLEAHEAAETELLTDAVYTDLGDSS